MFQYTIWDYIYGHIDGRNVHIRLHIDSDRTQNTNKQSGRCGHSWHVAMGNVHIRRELAYNGGKFRRF